MDLVQRICSIGAVPGEHPDAGVTRGIVVVASLTGALLTTTQAIIFHNGGWHACARIQLAQAILLVVNVLLLPLHRSFPWLVRTAIVVVMFGAVAAGMFTGDLVMGGLVAVWSLMGPLAGALFLSRREATLWLVVQVVTAIAAGLTMPVLPSRPAPPEWLERYLFANNVTFLSVFITLTVLALVQARQRAMIDLSHEHDRSERLLLNVLPPSIARRLKQQPGTIADRFDDVTILFADIVGFTTLSASIPPEELVMMLNELFSEFDRLAEQHGLEKIKTIGDAYMVVGGLPERRADHADAVAEMALDMLAAIRRHREQTGRSLDVRIGINTGPVVAGVIGRKKFIYDLWGDAVNTASRMESHGVTGGIQVAESTFEKLHARFVLEERGRIQVKGKGEMRTHLLVGRRPLEARA